MDTSYSIRDFSPEDYGSLLELWEKTDMGGSERADKLNTIENTLMLGGRLFVMAGPSKRVIGSSWLSVDGRRVYLHHFAIHQDYQGQGLSKPLLEKSLEYCKVLGLQVKIEVHNGNYKALKLYKNFGFKELGEYSVFIIRDI